MAIFYLGGRRDGELQIQLDRNEEDEDSRPPGGPNKNNQERVEEELVCPYDSRHRIRPERFAHHLNKCRRTNRRREEFVVCHYNFQHHVLRTQIAAHYENCQDYEDFLKRNGHDIDAMNFGQENPGNHPPINQEVTTDENWDIVDVSVSDESSDKNSA